MRRLVLMGLSILCFWSTPIMAISANDLHAVLYDSVFSDANNGGFDCSGGKLPVQVPDWGRQIFTDAANHFNVAPALIAAIYWREHGGNFAEPPPPYGHGKAYASSGIPASEVWPDNVVGARGPFQFEYHTWLGYLNANPTHKIDTNDPAQIVASAEDLKDAAYGAAKKLAALGATVGAPTGTLSDTYQGPSIIAAIRQYNEGNPTPPDQDLGYVRPAYNTYTQLIQADASTPCVTNGSQTLFLAGSPCVGITDKHLNVGASTPQLCPWVPVGGFAPNEYTREGLWGECTWWAQYNYSIPIAGNGGDWFANAAKRGLPTSHTPNVGDAVSFGGSFTGHVAFVIAVDPNGHSFTISEANQDGRAGDHNHAYAEIDTRVIPVTASNIIGFIGPDPVAAKWAQEHPGQTAPPTNPAAQPGVKQ